MRAVLGVVSILIVLVVVGLLVRKQLGETPASPGVTAQVRSQQIQQQIKQSVEAGMQPRAMPDDEK